MQTMSEVQKGIDDLIMLLKVKYNLTVYKTTGTVHHLSYDNGVHVAELYYSNNEEYTWVCPYYGKKAVRKSINIGAMKRTLKKDRVVPSRETIDNNLLKDIENFECVISLAIGNKQKGASYKSNYEVGVDTVHALIQHYFNKKVTYEINSEQLLKIVESWNIADAVSNNKKLEISRFTSTPLHVIGYNRNIESSSYSKIYYGMINKTDKYEFTQPLKQINSKEDLPDVVKIKLMMEEIANPDKNRAEYKTAPFRLDSLYAEDFGIVYRSVYTSNAYVPGGIGWVIIKV